MADTAVIHPHLSGLLSPLRSEDGFDMRVRSRIPDALNGAYYCNGPNLQFDPPGSYHAFIGDGMIHAFYLKPDADGGRARYHNRWVRTPRWEAEHKAGRSLFGGMGMPSDPSVANVNPGGANTNIVSHAGRLMALREQSEPFELESKSFDGTGRFMSAGGGSRTAAQCANGIPRQLGSDVAG